MHGERKPQCPEKTQPCMEMTRKLQTERSTGQRGRHPQGFDWSSTGSWSSCHDTVYECLWSELQLKLEQTSEYLCDEMIDTSFVRLPKFSWCVTRILCSTFLFLLCRKGHFCALFFFFPVCPPRSLIHFTHDLGGKCFWPHGIWALIPQLLLSTLFNMNNVSSSGMYMET